MKLLLITDAKIASKNGQSFIFNSIALELQHLNETYSECHVIGICSSYSADLVKINGIKFSFTAINNDGVSLRGYSLKYLFDLIYNVFIKVLKFDVVHVRGPGLPMFVGLLISIFFPQKKWWFKYANDWTQNGKSFFWDLQKKMLKSFFWVKVSLNGNWPNLPSHIINLENPCIVANNKGVIRPRPSKEIVKIAYVGRLTLEKGVFIGFEALDRLQKGNPKIRVEFIVIGDGPERKALSELDCAISMSILGLQSKDYVLDLLSNCDLILLPTLSPEGFPKVIAEAMSVGCIPVVTNVSCIEEYIDNYENGFIIDSKDKDLIGQIFEILTYFLLMKDGVRNSMRLKAQDTAFNYFTYERFFERVNNLILN